VVTAFSPFSTVVLVIASVDKGGRGKDVDQVADNQKLSVQGFGHSEPLTLGFQFCLVPEPLVHVHPGGEQGHFVPNPKYSRTIRPFFLRLRV
jgi:hypothetical protein